MSSSEMSAAVLPGSSPRGLLLTQNRNRDPDTNPVCNETKNNNCKKRRCTCDFQIILARLSGILIAIIFITEIVTFTYRMSGEIQTKNDPDRNAYGDKINENLAETQFFINAAVLVVNISSFLISHEKQKRTWNMYSTFTVLLALFVLDFITALSKPSEIWWFCQIGIDLCLYFSTILYFNFVEVSSKFDQSIFCFNVFLLICYLINVFGIHTLVEEDERGSVYDCGSEASSLLRYLTGITDGLIIFELLHDALSRLKEVSFRIRPGCCCNAGMAQKKKKLNVWSALVLHASVLCILCSDIIVTILCGVQVSYNEDLPAIIYHQNTSAQVMVMDTIATPSQRIMQLLHMILSGVFAMIMLLLLWLGHKRSCPTDCSLYHQVMQRIPNSIDALPTERYRRGLLENTARTVGEFVRVHEQVKPKP